MLLQPRKFKYKTIFKMRKNKKIFKKQVLSYGQGGLQLTKPLMLNSKKIFRLKIFIKKAVRKGDKTKRNFIFNAFPYIPLSKKNIGSRMGKGKGKLATWKSIISPGHILIEFKNLRYGRLNYFIRQLKFKLKGTSKLLIRNPHITNINNPLGTKKIKHQSFW